MQDLINIETGTVYFGNKEYISIKTTYDEILKMKGTIDDNIELLNMGIKILHFHNKEIDSRLYQFSFHFDFEKLSTIFIIVKDEKEMLELPFWKNLKRMKIQHNSIKKQMRRKNYDWGSVFASYHQKVNVGYIIINLK